MPVLTDNRDPEVSIAEQGSPDFEIDTTEITATGAEDIVFTVPTGKKWLLKAARMLKLSGTFTVSNYQLIIRNSDSSEEITAIDTGSSAMAELIGNHTLTVPSGWKVICRYVISAHTSSGNVKSTVLYNETDE